MLLMLILLLTINSVRSKKTDISTGHCFLGACLGFCVICNVQRNFWIIFDQFWHRQSSYTQLLHVTSFICIILNWACFLDDDFTVLQTNRCDDGITHGEDASVTLVVADVDVAIEADGTDIEQWTVAACQTQTGDELTETGVLYKPRLSHRHTCTQFTMIRWWKWYENRNFGY